MLSFYHEAGLNTVWVNLTSVNSLHFGVVDTTYSQQRLQVGEECVSEAKIPSEGEWKLSGLLTQPCHALPSCYITSVSVLCLSFSYKWREWYRLFLEKVLVNDMTTADIWQSIILAFIFWISVTHAYRRTSESNWLITWSISQLSILWIIDKKKERKKINESKSFHILGW